MQGPMNVKYGQDRGLFSFRSRSKDISGVISGEFPGELNPQLEEKP
jgi:hypothetical protein